jgi:hypothetical protein
VVWTHNAAGGITQLDERHEYVTGLHIEYQKRKMQAQQSPHNNFETPDDDQ